MSISSLPIRLPETGQYGIKVRGTREDGNVHEPLYDYVIDYRKPKKRVKSDPTIEQEAKSFGSTGIVLYWPFLPVITDSVLI
jgi:hypothetical protein